MPPANSKANYKTYEAQARMVRAIVAAHPEVKWNYKDIAKYFGQSTTDGIQFQFRTIKKDAEALRQTANDGGDVANCLSLGTGTPGTPSKPTPARSQPGSRSGKGAKRKVAVPVSSPIKRSLSDDEDEDFDTNYDAMDVTPSKRAKTTGRPAQNPTPSRSAAVKAAATIADASAQMYSSESPPEEVATPTGPVMAAPVLAPPAAAPAPVAHTSIFGHVERKPQTSDFMTGPPHNLNMMNTPTAAFPDIFDSPDIFGTGHNDASYMDYGGDGEI